MNRISAIEKVEYSIFPGGHAIRFCRITQKVKGLESPALPGTEIQTRKMREICMRERTLFSNFFNSEIWMDMFVIPDLTTLHVTFLSILLRALHRRPQK